MIIYKCIIINKILKFVELKVNIFNNILYIL